MNRIFLKSAFILCVGLLSLADAATEKLEKPKVGDDIYAQLNLFGEVLERVKSSYVEDVNNQKLIESAINGMLTSLDPHSSYMNAESFEDMRVQTKGEFGGLGIEVTLDAGFVKVVSPIDGTPAAKAGIQAGDYITHLDETQVLGLTLQEAVEKMRGKVGEPIKLTVHREGVKEPLIIKLKRDVIEIRAVRSGEFNDIGYIRITTFNDNTYEDLVTSIQKIKKDLGSNLKGYVVDLRNNPGGLLDQAVLVSDAFLERGEIVSTRSRNMNDIRRYSAESGDLTDGKPLVVLINGGSASASEIVSGALKEHKRAVLVGTKTFGKGSVQSIMPLASGEGALRLTTALYYTPSGTSIQATGIAPDVEIAGGEVTIKEKGKAFGEQDLPGHLINERERQEKAKKLADKKNDAKAQKSESESGVKILSDEELSKDLQLKYAFDLMQVMPIIEEVSDVRKDVTKKQVQDVEIKSPLPALVSEPSEKEKSSEGNPKEEHEDNQKHIPEKIVPKSDIKSDEPAAKPEKKE